MYDRIAVACRTQSAFSIKSYNLFSCFERFYFILWVKLCYAPSFPAQVQNFGCSVRFCKCFICAEVQILNKHHRRIPKSSSLGLLPSLVFRFPKGLFLALLSPIARVSRPPIFAGIFSQLIQFVFETRRERKRLPKICEKRRISANFVELKGLKTCEKSE